MWYGGDRMSLSGWRTGRTSRACLAALAVLAGPATEFATVALPSSPNLAWLQPVASSGPNWGSFKPGALTDGDAQTFTHPLAETGTLGFYYEVDLGRPAALDHVLLRNRADGCCPERLTHFRVEVWSDAGGRAGQRVWAASARADGSHSGVGGVDRFDASADPQGVFAGRFLRVVNEGGDAYSPQLAEIEAYGTPPPEIRQFSADRDALNRGETATLRWEIVGAEQALLEPGGQKVNPTNGTIVVSPTATTVYRLTATREGVTATADLTLGVDVVLSPPDLVEFSADNSGELRDEDGDASDWIELRNPNAFGMSLAGYFLTDDPTQLMRWRIPEVRLPAGGAFVVFASGKDRSQPSGELHTNFRLSADGEYLALVDRDGQTIRRQFPANFPVAQRYPAQLAGVSYGIGSEGRMGFLPIPSPGQANGPVFEGVTAAPEFSVSRGLYDGEPTVTLATSTPGATIRYTLDGREPTASSGRVYAGPVTVTNTTVLRAAAFRETWASSRVVTHTYVLPARVIASSVMRRSITDDARYRDQMQPALRELPSLSLVALSTINDTTEVRASLEWLPADGTPTIQEDCGVSLYGGAFTDFPKKNFRLYFRREFGATKLRYPLFAGFERGVAAVEEFDQLELRGGSHDMEQRGFYVSNIFTDDTLLEMGQLNPHGRFVHLYLNGTYWGVFHLRERWGAAMHARYLGGEPSDYESINGNWNVGGWAEPGVPYDGDGSTWAKVKSLRGNYRAVRDWVDVPQYVDYLLMWMFGGAEDEYRCVGTIRPGSGFKFYLNDADGWFCIPAYCAAGDRTARGAPGRQAGDGPGSLFSMLFKEGDPEYRQLLADRVQRALAGDGALTPERNARRLLRRANELERPFLAEAARWGFLAPAEWRRRLDSVLNDWLPQRTAEVLAQFQAAGFASTVPAPTPRPAGGVVTNGISVTFSGQASGTIWYTLDGSDPRLPDGRVSPQARSYRVAGETETLVPLGARWRWHTDATGLSASSVVEGTAGWSAADWKHPAFGDAAWAEGPAQLGYGEGDEATVLPFGSAGAKWVTAYFRTRFTATNLAGLYELGLRVRRDDGLIVYLNGREVFRSAMPEGTVEPGTAGLGVADDGQGLIPATLPGEVLRQGENVLAAELHQSSPTTSDASFDLELVARRRIEGGAGAGDPPVLSGDTWLRSRMWDQGRWSGLRSDWFEVTEDVGPAADLTVTEFKVGTGADDGADFIELANLSSRPINLRGARFTEGLRFVFAGEPEGILGPKQRWVVTGDLVRFRERHGMDVPVAGVYQGHLDRSGERLEVSSASGAVLLGFRYGTRAPWPGVAEGTGHAFVLAEPELGLENPLAWRPSVSTEGSPGGTDSESFTGERLGDADADGLPAFVEYALGTSDHDALAGPDAVRALRDPSREGVLLEIERALAADDVRLSVEYSDDLVTWKPATWRATQEVSDGKATEWWRADGGPKESQFLRVRAELKAKLP